MATERRAEPTGAPPAPRSLRLSPLRAFALPFFFALGLAAFGLIGAVRANPRTLWGFVGAACALLAWTAVLFQSARQQGRTLTLELVARPQHYIQAFVQTSIYLYWGWHWRQVYDSSHLFVAQLVFAYAFDMLLVWSRRDTFTLGFGPFPVILSTNVFLWFKPDWFYFQFMMVALGFAAKELIRWQKEGRRTHIFNPSSFTLAVFSVALILTGTTQVTWGKEIAITQFYPPHMFLFLFLLSLPGQYLFGVTTMSMAAVVTTYVLGLAYFAATGIYFFYDSYIPISVFLGMHFLFTDPSTAPRTELGRMIFGALYGVTAVVLYEALQSAGLPEFYDKLLQVPLLNLSIQLIDRVARSKRLRLVDPSTLGRSLVGRRRNLAYITVWAIGFAIMSAAQGVGDDHPGQFLPFWQQACEKDRPYACSYLAGMQTNYCRQGSGWACNELGILQSEVELDRVAAAVSLERGCALGFLSACANVSRVTTGTGVLLTAPPTLADFPMILRGSKAPISDRTPAALYALACRQGWPDTCGRSGQTAGR